MRRRSSRVGWISTHAPFEGKRLRPDESVISADDHAKLFDRVEQTTGIVPFGRLVDQGLTVEPYRSARTVYWIVDNGSSHCGKTSVQRMTRADPNAKLIHLPVHALWLNQIEIYFSILQRKAMTPNDFATPREDHSSRWPAPWRSPHEPHHFRTRPYQECWPRAA